MKTIWDVAFDNCIKTPMKELKAHICLFNNNNNLPSSHCPFMTHGEYLMREIFKIGGAILLFSGSSCQAPPFHEAAGKQEILR